MARYMIIGMVRIRGESEDRGYYDATIRREEDVDLSAIVDESFNKVLTAFDAGVSLVEPVRKEEWRARKCLPRLVL
ncbi:MAG: hypothetical protein HY813_01090 [Candidatus Portnoybacteria bacterium]|nr:hypothetical protein [Candidatus Portnoybacteria bacterium]